MSDTPPPAQPGRPPGEPASESSPAGAGGPEGSGGLGGPPAPPPGARSAPAAGGLSSTPPIPPPQRTAWGARFAVLAVAAISGALGWVAATRFLPEWWARQIADVADGTLTAGIAAGLTCGIAFTLLPLLVLRGTLRRGATWSARFAYLVLAFLLAVPNLITLGVVVGSGSSATDARGVLDLYGRGFRGATLFGAVVGALLAIGLWTMLWRGHRRNREIADLRGKLARKDTGGTGDTRDARDDRDGADDGGSKDDGSRSDDRGREAR